MLRQHVNWADVGEVKENDLTYAIARAGMASAGKRIRIGTDREFHSIIIVKGPWSPETVQNATNTVLEAIIKPQVEVQQRGRRLKWLRSGSPRSPRSPVTVLFL